MKEKRHFFFCGVLLIIFCIDSRAQVQGLGQYRDIFQRGIKLNHISTDGGFTMNKGLYSGDSLITNNLSQFQFHHTVGLSMAGIPFKAEYAYRHSQPDFSPFMQPHWYKINFDIEQYKQQWKQLATKFSALDLTKAGTKFRELDQAIRSKLRSVVKDLAHDKVSTQLDSITQNFNPLDLASKNPEEIASLLFGQDLDKLMEVAKEKLKADTTNREIQKTITELEEKKKYISSLVEVLKLAETAGILKDLKENGEKAAEEYQQLLKDPQALAQRIAAKLKLNGVERLFTLLSQFKLGANEVPFAHQVASPFLSKGISFEINIKDKFIGFSMGRLFPVINSLQFSTLDSQAKQKQPNYWMLEYRKGKLTESHKGIKLTSVKNTGANINVAQQPDFKDKHTLLLNIYSKERLFGNNWLSAEISKSVPFTPGQYVIDGNGRSVNRKPTFLDFKNVGLKVRFEGTVEKIGLTHQAYFNRSAGTTYNFTTTFPVTNGYETGFSLRVKQKNKKLSAYLKGSARVYDIPGFTEGKWKTHDLRTKITYKLKKSQYLQLGGNLHNGYKTYLFSQAIRTIRQNSKGLNFDANLVNKRIFGLYNTSFVSLGYLVDAFPVYTTIEERWRSHSFTAVLNQSFLLREHVVAVNLSYLKVSRNIDALFYNSQFDADLGGQFRFNDKLSIGCSMVYGYLKGAYSNAGLKMNLSAMVCKKISLDLYADLRKNIKLTNPLFDQFINLNGGIKYVIK